MASAAAELLPVKGRASKTGYGRSRFGIAWKDTDKNGCDQREDVLNRDLTHKVDGPANESKGDGDTATWLPPNGRQFVFHDADRFTGTPAKQVTRHTWWSIGLHAVLLH